MASGATAIARGKPAPSDVAPSAAPPSPTPRDTQLEPPAQPAAAAEVRKMPLPPGRCVGRYTAEARAAATEGVVVLDLVIDETGHTRDITVVQGLPHGLTEAAVAALEACRFTAGEKDGKPVPVRIRGFKIFNLHTGAITSDFLADVSTDSSTIRIAVLASSIGLTPANPRFSYTASAFDLLSTDSDSFAGSARYNAFHSAVSDAQFLTLPPDSSSLFGAFVDLAELALTPARGWMVISEDNKNGPAEAQLLKLPAE